MRLHSLINSRIVFVTLCCLGLAAGVLSFRARADQWDKKTILTVNQTIQVKDKVLEPGQYVFKLLDSSSNRNIVQIFNADQSRIIDTVLAIPNYRLQPTDDSQFRFWETPPGHAKALRAWFYPGENYGQEFPYPKHLAMVETASAKPVTAPPAMETSAEEKPVPQQESMAEQPAQEPQAAPEKPVEIAQSSPPPAPATTAQPPAEPAAATQQQPETLPKTASPYPLLGLAGLLSVGIYGLLRLKRPA